MPPVTITIPHQHEPDRLPIPVIVWTAVSLVLTVLVVHLVVWSILLRPFPPQAMSVPETPALRDWGTAGREELQRLRQREDANLNTYQWLDARHSAARIPIERAMEVVARQPNPRTQP